MSEYVEFADDDEDEGHEITNEELFGDEDDDEEGYFDEDDLKALFEDIHGAINTLEQIITDSCVAYDELETTMANKLYSINEENKQYKQELKQAYQELARYKQEKENN